MMKSASTGTSPCTSPLPPPLRTVAVPGTAPPVRMRPVALHNAPLSYSPPATPRSARTDAGPAPAADPLAAYALTPAQAHLLARLLEGSGSALDPAGFQTQDAQEEQARLALCALRAALTTRALDNRIPLALPSPPATRPSVKGGSSPVQVFRSLLAKAPGLVVGSRGAGARVLGENLQALRKLGVDTLYLDHLQSDRHQSAIDDLHRTGRCPADLRQFLDLLEQRGASDASVGAGYADLLDMADQAGMRVVALDLAASHCLAGVARREHMRDLTALDLRARVLSHVAVARIEHDQATLPAAATRRWVALMDPRSAGVFNGQPGVAARLGVQSLRVEEAALGPFSTLRAGFDPGHVPAPKTDDGYLRCDHLLQLRPARAGATDPMRPGPCTADDAERARQLHAAVARCAPVLWRVATFRMVALPCGEQWVVHRSRDSRLVAQRIEPLRCGGVKLRLAEDASPRNWGHLQRTFPSLEALKVALCTRLEEASVADLHAGR